MELSLIGKTVLVTGATDGIGLQTALTLAKMGPRLFILGRNKTKTEQTADRIRHETGNPTVETLVGDLSSQSEVRRLASEFKARSNRLNILINNAGAVFVKRQLSPDGLEMTFALNHMGYFLFTTLLMDVITASAPARIINVSSAAHMGAALNLDDLQNERGYTGFKAYSQSKLANIYFTYELARRLNGSGVAVNALHPGFVATNFGKSNGGLFRSLFGLIQFAAIKPDDGAATSIYLATSPEVEGVSGQYFDKCKAVKSSPISYDPQIARRLWESSLQLAHLPETSRI